MDGYGKLEVTLSCSVPPKGGLVRITSKRSFSVNLRTSSPRVFLRVRVERKDAVQDHVHAAHQVRQGLFLLAVEGGLLKLFVVLGQDAVAQGGPHVLVGLDQEARRAHGRVVDRLAEFRVHHLDNELDDRPGGVELAAHAALAPELGEHGFVEVRQGVHVLGGVELDFLNGVDGVAQDGPVLEHLGRRVGEHAPDDRAGAVALAGRADREKDRRSGKR